jgi:hypothetical protein
MAKNRLILEFTEFNAQRMNPDSSQMAVSVENPQLSINAFDKHLDKVRTAISNLEGIVKNLTTSSTFRSLRSMLSLEEQNVDKLKILRITSNDRVNYDAYISFLVHDKEYFGVVKNILNHLPRLVSEVFKDSDLVQSKEWRVKVEGLIIKTIKAWLKPEIGEYTLLKSQILCTNNITGEDLLLKEGSDVKVIRSMENSITIEYDNKFYNLTGDNFIYFNYWFKNKK